MWAIRGRIVPLPSDPAVAPNNAADLAGGVWVGDDGADLLHTLIWRALAR